MKGADVPNRKASPDFAAPRLLLERDQHQVTAIMLTAKQARFVEEYLVGLNGKQAAIRAVQPCREMNAFINNGWQ
jgi:hypothetical protein